MRLYCGSGWGDNRLPLLDVLMLQAFSMPAYKDFDRLAPGDDKARAALQEVCT